MSKATFCHGIWFLIAASAGNDGDNPLHVEADLAPGESRSTVVEMDDPSMTYVDIWSAPGEDFAAIVFLVDEDGNRTKLSGGFYPQMLDRNVPTENFPYSDWSYNPITEIENRDLGYKELNARIQGGLTVHLLEGLDFDTKIQYEMYNTFYTDIYNENTFTVRRLINTTSSWDKTTNVVTPNLAKGGFKEESKEEITSYNFRNQLNFDRVFKDRHALNVILGTEIRERIAKTTDYPRTYGYSDETLSVGIYPNGPTGTLDWTGFPNGMMDNAFEYTNSYTYNRDRYFSLYANAAYTLDEKYTVSGSVRTDASNLITDDPKYRYAPFWSVGLGWQIGKEDFMQDAKWIDRLNIRATYGYNGNVDKSTSFRPLISVNSTQNEYTHGFTAAIQSFGNPDLRWERTGTWDVGIDYSFLGGKLAGKIDVYSKLGKDLMASMSGFGSSSDGTVTIPYTTARKVTGQSSISSLEIYIADTDYTDQLSSQVEGVLYQAFNQNEDSYFVFAMDSLLDTMNEMLSMLTYMLAGIASIALLVGGIGIMNMMLVSVSERKQEIGLRKAMGATPGRIQLQFLLESVVLSLIGGMIGVILGLLISMAAAALMDTEFVFSASAVALGVGFSTAVGIIFGWAPARKASRLSPIDALRSE